MTLPTIERTFPTDNPSDLLPAITADNEAYWNGLAEGKLVVQGCKQCKRLRFPSMPVCPSCGSTDFDWQSISGEGELFSWVRYQRLFLQEFSDLMPYVVITAQMEKGIRIVGRLLQKVELSESPPIGAKVWLVRERWPNGRFVPIFSLKKPD